MQIDVKTTMLATTRTTVDVPVASWDEVERWYVSFDKLYYLLRGKKRWKEITLNSPDEGGIDNANPLSVEVRDPETRKLLGER